MIRRSRIYPPLWRGVYAIFLPSPELNKFPYSVIIYDKICASSGIDMAGRMVRSTITFS